MSNWKKDNVQTGRKLVIKGKLSKEDILLSIIQELTTMEETYGIEYFADVNLYFQIYKDDEKKLIVNNDFQIPYIIHEPNSTNYKTVTTLDDGTKNVKYNNEVDFNKLLTRMNNIKKISQKSSDHYHLLTAKQYTLILNNRK